MVAHRPKAVVFDVNETLFSLEGLRLRFEALGLPRLALEWWFAVVLRDGFALAASGDIGPFPALAHQALVEVLRASRVEEPEGALESILAGLAQLEPHPDVRPALTALREQGVAAMALTNGSADNVRLLVDRAGLADLLDRVVSVDEVRHWKPRPEPYIYAAGQIGVKPQALAVVAAHPWDIHGAARAGLVTGWVNRSERTFPSLFAFPHVRGASLFAVVNRLLALPDR